ncbi:hypothetical protein ACOMHN_027827 [Nucella lapillus]
MQGWVVYERCRERILLRLPPPKDVKGKKWRGWSRPGSPRAKGREAQSYTVMPDSPVPQHRHLGANDYDLYRQSPPYQKGGSSSLGHDPLHTDTRQNQGPACPDIHQTSLQQNLTRLDSSRPDLDSHSVYPDSLEVKDPMQCEADEDWQEFYLSHCLNAGNVWKLCWEDDQSLSPIFDEGQQSLARTQCRQRDDVDRLLFPVYEDSLQSLARRPCPQRDDMDRALFPVLDKDQPGVDRALSPIVEEGCQSLAETSTSPVPEENQEKKAVRLLLHLSVFEKLMKRKMHVPTAAIETVLLERFQPGISRCSLKKTGLTAAKQKRTPYACGRQYRTRIKLCA